ncbi:restriction endonuclease subunit S [Photobacterium leiognathi]|uniref:restriction endonuclease subunit S n=1 Tax=Photobacterium leiognathi TaxID=553611 RepID=UPI00298154C2|nr:restriction endonuclease subunit S [Photobacterium leiognathi]
MSELPKGWVSVCLNDVVDKIVGGGTPSKSKPSYYTGEIPWMTVKDMNKLYLTDTIDHITQEAVDNSSTNVIPAGTPIIATRMSLGKIVRANFDSAINQDLKAIFVNSSINKFYFEYWYRSKSMLIESLGTGTTVKGVRLEVLKDLKFPLSSLNEQKRIVEKLDEVLAQVDTIKARLDGIPAILKRFRQSVLAAAVSGKLTLLENNSPNFSKLGDCGIDIKTGPFGSALHKADYIEGGISVINPMHINDGKITPANQMSITVEKYESLSAWHLRDDDVVVGRRGEMGRAAVVKEVELKPCLCGTGSMILRSNDNINSEYLCYVLRSPIAVSYFNATSVGSTMVNLNQKVIKNLEVYFPSKEEQDEIVRLVEQYFAFADTIEAQVKKAQARVDNLTQSILAKAFRGELVAQDPNDEPADKLLERIAAARKEADALAKAAKKAAPKKRTTKAKTTA